MNKRNILNSIIVFFLVFVILGCGDRSGNKNNSSSGQEGLSYKDSSDGTTQDGMIEIVDIIGRKVTVPRGNVRVILDTSFMLPVLAPVFGKNGNPFTYIVGWNDELEKYNPDAYAIYREKFPEMDTIPTVGSLYRGDFSVEKSITLNADILFLSLHNFAKAQEMGLIKNLDKSGIRTVVIDTGRNHIRFFVPSILLLGQIFEKTHEAITFINYSFRQMEKVYSVLDTMSNDKKPIVFMETAPGMLSKTNEYMIAGSSHMGHHVELAGGNNYGSSMFGNSYREGRTITTEQLLTVNPDVIIATGLKWDQEEFNKSIVPLGYKTTREEIESGMKEIISRTGWHTLKAVKNKRVHGIYLAFDIHSAYFVSVQQIAKWLYPDDFAHLNPEETLKEFHDKFLPIDYSGMFWASLE